MFLSQFGLHAAGRRHCYISGTYGLIVSKPSSLIKYTSEYHKTTYYFPFPFTEIRPKNLKSYKNVSTAWSKTNNHFGQAINQKVLH